MKNVCVKLDLESNSADIFENPNSLSYTALDIIFS